MFNDWTEKYEYIIDLGKSLPVINDAFKTSKKLHPTNASSIGYETRFLVPKPGKIVIVG